MRILLLNGPNLQLLGVREPSIYGTGTLAELENRCRERAQRLGVELECRQSNHEGVLVDWIGGIPGEFDGLLLNAGGYTHTSVALRDAVVAVSVPTVEVHLSNIFAREEFRRRSYLSDVVWAMVCGMGVTGYELALEALVSHIRELR